MKKYILIYFLFFSFLFGNIVNNYNSIYYLAENSRTHSLAKIHTLATDVSGVFSQPLSSKNISGDIFLSYLNHFDSSINLIQFGYCILHDKNKNISIGFINRKINNIDDTSKAWNPLDQYDEPDFNEIDYNNINDLQYQNFGFSISYSKFLNKNNINVKIKPYYESIKSTNSIGLDLDFMLYRKIKNLHFVFGVNDFLSYKKWNDNSIEKNKINYFISTSIYSDNFGFFIEANYLFNERFGFEYNYNSSVILRLGIDSADNLSYGLSFNSDSAELSYAYIPVDTILGNINQLSISFKFDGLRKLKGKLEPENLIH